MRFMDREATDALIDELCQVSTAAEGPSNDDHIAALEGALSVALDVIEEYAVSPMRLADLRRYRRGALHRNPPSSSSTT